MTLQFTRFFAMDNAKAIKAREYGWLNAISYMSPHRSNGLGANLCAGASPECIKFCLGPHSGHAAIIEKGKRTNRVLQYRKRKARYFIRDHKAFMAETLIHVAKAYRTAEAKGFKLCIRLNGSSDIPFENIRTMVTFDLARELTKICDREILVGNHTAFSAFPFLQFDDYTKVAKRFDRTLPANLDLTFSRSETNEAECLALLARGHRVAVIFAGAFPKSWHGYPVVDGDLHDLRHLNPRNCVVGLTPKGHKMKASDTPFKVAA